MNDTIRACLMCGAPANKQVELALNWKVGTRKNGEEDWCLRGGGVMLCEHCYSTRSVKAIEAAEIESILKHDRGEK